MKYIIFGVAVLTLGSGCVTSPSYRVEQGWVKPNVDQVQAKKQVFDCTEKAKAAAQRETQVGGLMESCMALEGYAWGEYKTPLN